MDAATIELILRHGERQSFWDIGDDQTIADAYTLIHKHNGIQTLPVYRMEPQESAHIHCKSYYALLTSKDLLKFVLSRRLLDRDERIMQMLVSEIFIQLKAPSLRVFRADDTLSELASYFSKTGTGVLVNDGSLFHFVAPIDLLRYLLAHHRSIFGNKGGSVVDSLLSEKSIVHPEDSALVAAEKLVLSPFNAIPVLSGRNADVAADIVGNLSVSDYYAPNDLLTMLARLHDGIYAFLGSSLATRDEALLSHRSFTAADVAEKLLKYHIHQLWNVDGRHVSIIGMADVFSLLC